MSEIVNQSLQKIAKGTGIIFIGTIRHLLLSTCYNKIFVTISILGLNEGSTRYIAYFNFMGWKKVL